MKFNIKNTLAMILGIQACLSLAKAQDVNLTKLRFAENLTSNERIELRKYLAQLAGQGYKLDLKNNVVAIDSDNRVYFIKKDSEKAKLLFADEPSCYGGGL